MGRVIEECFAELFGDPVYQNKGAFTSAETKLD